MSTRRVGPCPAVAWTHPWWGRHLGLVLVALVSLALLGGCATGAPRGSLTSGFGLHSWPSSVRSNSGPRQWITPVSAGSGGGFPGQEPDIATEPLLVVIEELAQAPWEGMGEGSPLTHSSCGGQPLPSGWPELSSNDAEALLAPFLECTPAQFVELQDAVDMPRLVEKLDGWHAVRLGALGPVREDAAGVLNRKRASFLVHATEEYGAANAEVFALFLLHSAFDDDLKEVLLLLARDKRLGDTLGDMAVVREELERRGARLSDHPERDFEWSDLARGAGRAGTDFLNSSLASNGSRGLNLSRLREQLPPPYQRALDEVERSRVQRHFSPGNVALGSFDELTFGVPLGFYNLATGTGHGLYSLSQGQYEQATRELTPATLLVSLYAGAKGARYLSEARGGTGTASGGVRRLQLPEQRLRALKEMARQLEARLGVDGLRELAKDIQASREAGRLVAVGGVDAAVALREARGDVAKAQAWLSQADSEAAGPTSARGGAGKLPGGVASLVDEVAGSTPRSTSAGKSLGSLASLVDEKAGLTPEVVEAKLARVELDSAGSRLSGDMAALRKHRPSLDAPPPGARGNPRWSEYVAYYENRIAELEQGMAVKWPLEWAGYERMRGNFARGLAFERAFVEVLRADAALPRAMRRYLQDFHQPRIETYVGVKKLDTGLRFADVLIVEGGELAGPLPRVETFSFKSRNLSLLKRNALRAQMKADASEALRYYGEALNIRRPSLELLDKQVPVYRVRLIYEGGELKPQDVKLLERTVKGVNADVNGVEVLFQ